MRPHSLQRDGFGTTVTRNRVRGALPGKGAEDDSERAGNQDGEQEEAEVLGYLLRHRASHLWKTSRNNQLKRTNSAKSRKNPDE